MAATASVRLNSVATPNETYHIGDSVSLSNSDDAGVSTWAWSLLSKPEGSSAAMASQSSPSTSFVVDKEGGYLVRLIVNDNLPDEDQDTALARILTQHVQLHGHAKDETGESDPTEGWAKPWRESYLKIDKRLGLADKRTVKYTGSAARGPKLLTITGTAVLPNGDTVPTVDTLDAGAPGRGVYLWEGRALATDAVLTVLAHGMSTLLPNPDALAPGDPVYLGAAGAITRSIPAIDGAYLVGYCVLVNGTNVALWFEPAARFNNATHPANSVVDIAAVPGTSPHMAHADHNHTLITSAGPTADIDGSAGAAGTSGTPPARADHVHRVVTGLPIAVVADASASIGIGPSLSMHDHQHGLTTFSSNPADVAAAPSPGTSAAALSRGDHVHAHGNAGGGASHLTATPLLAGFMSAADKARLDAGNVPNLVMNGGLRFWQRGLQFPVVVVSDVGGFNFHGYMADRWYAQTREDRRGRRRINVIYSRATAPDLPKTDDVCRIRNNNARATGHFYQFVQEIDRDVVRSIRGKHLAWNVRVRKGATSPPSTDVFVEVVSNTGAASERLAAYAGSALLESTLISGTTLTQSVQTFTGVSKDVVPATATGLCIYVGSYQNGDGPGDADDYIEFGEVSMVVGDSPRSEFDWATGDINTEFQVLQKYYEKNYDIDTPPGTAGVASQGINLVYQQSGPAGRYGGGIVYRVRKRIAPTVALYSPDSGAANNAATGSGDTGVDVTGGGECGVNVETTASPPAGLVAQVMFAADAEL